MNNVIFDNTFWIFIEKIISKVFTVIISIILARILNPDIYGTVSLVLVFISILSVFVESGFGIGLIQKKEVNDADYSTVFFLNVLISILLYLLLFITSPYIEKFYDIEGLSLIIKVLSLTLIDSSIRNIQHAYVAKNLLFKKKFFSSLISTVISGIISIYMAFNGYGVWSLVFQILIKNILHTLMNFILINWRPSFIFSYSCLKSIFTFSWQIILSNLFNKVYNNLRSLLIGKKYTEKDLAFYNKAESYPNVIDEILNSTIDSILLPVLSSNQDNYKKIKEKFILSLNLSLYVITPVMVGLFVCSEPIVNILLTAKWMPIVPYIKIFCISYMFSPLSTVCLNILKSIGKSKTYLKIEIIKKTIDIFIVIVLANISVKAIAYSTILISIISTIINLYTVKKILDINYKILLKEITPIIINSILMGIATYFIGKLIYIPIFKVILQILSGITIYIIGSKVLKLNSYKYILDIVRLK